MLQPSASCKLHCPTPEASHTYPWANWRKADSTLRSSQAVPHPSTDRALSRLTSEVERDPVHSTWYGRQRMYCLKKAQNQLLPVGSHLLYEYKRN